MLTLIFKRVQAAACTLIFRPDQAFTNSIQPSKTHPTLVESTPGLFIASEK